LKPNIPIGTAEHPIKVNILMVIKNGIKLYKLIKRLLRQLNKERKMCFKKIIEWFKPDPLPPVVEEHHSKTVLHFAINNYPGSQNDLNGCINDQIDFEAFINANYPDFVVEKFKDSEVTWQRLHDEIRNHIVALKQGDILVIGYSGHGTYGPDATEENGNREGLYPYDGKVFWDDDFRELLDLIPEGAKVYIFLDSCFSGGSTFIRNSYIKNRFMPLGDYEKKPKTRRMLRSENMNYLLFAGCTEEQTCADAYIENRYNGAFTYYLIRAWNKEINNSTWNYLTASGLYKGRFEQTPKLLGNEAMKANLALT
jgi:hypothetical protein